MVIMWTPVTQSGTWPSSRSKHAGCVHVATGHVYLLAGRNGNVALRDFWKYTQESNSWERIQSKGSAPGCLQGHSMVEHQDTLYVFGGELSFCNDQETPLWMYHIKENTWVKYVAPRGVVTPKGRRGHTAVVHEDSMYVYGGYQDLRGSSSELWTFHFPSQTWHLVSQGGSPECFLQSQAKHHHSAVVHNDAMWVFGGMSDLQERSDLWKFDFVSRCWQPVRSKPGPGCLHSHSAVKIHNHMIIFGGERDGQTVNEVWKFHFATETWDRVLVQSLSPQPRSQLVSFVIGSGEAGEGSGQLTSLGQPAPATPSLTRHAKAVVQRLKGEAESILDSRHSGRQRYSFLPPDSCAEDSDEEEEEVGGEFQRYKELPRELYRDITRPSQFKRLDSSVKARATKDRPGNIVKDLAKVNLSLLNSGHYNILTNQSSDSLNSVQDREDILMSYELARPGAMTKSDSVSTWQSYSCSSTLSSHYRDYNEVNTEDEESSGYDSFDGAPASNNGVTNVVSTGQLSSLLNPSYSGPDVDTHNSYAAVLNCPQPDTSSPCGPDNKGRQNVFEGVEMRERRSSSSRVTRGRPRSEIVTSSVSVTNHGWVGARPVSDSDMATIKVDTIPQVTNMVMVVMGGREVGQVNMFQRNISLWKLKL